MKRHIVRKHNCVNTIQMQPNSHSMQPNSHSMQPNSHSMQPNSHSMQPNSHSYNEPYDKEVITKHVCIKCNKELSRQWILKKHILRCKGIINTHVCEYCNTSFKNKRSKYGHYNICKVKKEKDATRLISSTQDINNKIIGQNLQKVEIINNIGRDQNTQNIINILTFPQQGDGNFDFICDQITKATMKGLLQCSNTAQAGFNNFINKVMENPQNRIVHKTNPNCTYSKIHIGDGKWEFAHDDDVFPILTHHMTTAALEKVQEVNKDIELVKELYSKLEPLRNYVTNINEMDYESEPYKGVLQRIKLIIVNLTRRWCEENREEFK